MNKCTLDVRLGCSSVRLGYLAKGVRQNEQRTLFLYSIVRVHFVRLDFDFLSETVSSNKMKQLDTNDGTCIHPQPHTQTSLSIEQTHRVFRQVFQYVTRWLRTNIYYTHTNPLPKGSNTQNPPQQIMSETKSAIDEESGLIFDDGIKPESEPEQKEAIQEPEPTSISFNINNSRITDQYLIDRFNREFNNKFFIPKQEEETYDLEELAEKNYVKSAKRIGGQIFPIAIAVCSDDPTMKTGSDTFNPESIFRVHGRIADGRHRYIEAIDTGTIWKAEYYNVKNFEEYMQLRAHMDSKKKAHPNEMKNKFIQLCEYKHKVLGIPKEQICLLLIKEMSPPYPESSIRNWIPAEYKSPRHAQSRLGKTKDITETKEMKELIKTVEEKNTKKLSRKDKKIEKLNQELDANFKEISTLQENIKDYKAIVTKYDNLKPFLKESHQAEIEGTDIKVLVELNETNKTVKVIKI